MMCFLFWECVRISEFSAALAKGAMAVLLIWSFVIPATGTSFTPNSDSYTFTRTWEKMDCPMKITLLSFLSNHYWSAARPSAIQAQNRISLVRALENTALASHVAQRPPRHNGMV